MSTFITSCAALVSSLTALQAPPDAGREPLWRIMIRDFPLDASAITIYVLFGFSVWLVWWANRKSQLRARALEKERAGAAAGGAARAAATSPGEVAGEEASDAGAPDGDGGGTGGRPGRGSRPPRRAA